MLGYEKGITLLKNQKGNGVAESAHVELLPKAQAHLPYAYERKRGNAAFKKRENGFFSSNSFELYVTLAIENGGESKTEGEQALVANVAAMPNMNWSNYNNNEDGGDMIHVNIGRC
ncbi:hypothetical protein JHK87_031023 [Glycine soja]|nr:hypothetical protein JHK87_031023 [Glycine soja]